MFKFTIRDLLWLMVVVGMGVGWRIDVARQEADYRNKLGSRESNYYGPDRRFILHVAKNHPELLVELNAIKAANIKNRSQEISLNIRFDNLVDKATDIYRRDTGKAPYTFFEEESAPARP